MNAVFDYKIFQEMISQFAAELPAILGSHATVADLAPRVERLLNIAETPFTIAIIGQMRSGKSSLLNSLIGADLAITGVNETTATINWFKHGNKEQEGRFRVEWRDRPGEEFPLSDIVNWVGDSEKARATRHIEFFRDIPFLRQANIVDTPGSRSVISDHTEVLQDFIKQERTTRNAGESADAIVYVLMPVARQNDAEFLADFEKTTRMPGSSPYNSMAVIHKWETLESKDPYSLALKKCESIRNSLGQMVSLVLPVSAPLAWAFEHFDAAFWEKMHCLVTNTPPEILEDMLLQEKDFCSLNEASCPIDIPARKRLRMDYKLPWPSFKVIIKTGQMKMLANWEDFRTAIGQISGIRQFRSALQDRFFARSRTIKALSILSKAWEPCQIASGRLRNHKNRFGILQKEAQDSISPLVAAIANGAHQLEPVQRYIEETIRFVEDDVRKASETLRRLGEKVLLIKDAYDDMEGDLRMLEKAEEAQTELGEDWTRILRGLFGNNGPALLDRLAPLLGPGRESVTVNDIERNIERARRQKSNTQPGLGLLFDHAVLRLSQMADQLEQDDSRKEL